MIRQVVLWNTPIFNPKDFVNISADRIRPSYTYPSNRNKDYFRLCTKIYDVVARDKTFRCHDNYISLKKGDKIRLLSSGNSAIMARIEVIGE